MLACSHGFSVLFTSGGHAKCEKCLPMIGLRPRREFMAVFAQPQPVGCKIGLMGLRVVNTKTSMLLKVFFFR